MKTGPSLQHRKQDFVRGAIWDAAVDLFVARGFDRTTVDDIARAAGVSRRSFFRYFSSKNDLMGQGIITYGAMITEAIRASARSATPFEVMRQTVEQVAVTAATYPRVRMVAQIASTSVAAREAQLSRLADVEDRVADAYRVRWRTASSDLTPRLLAELTLSVLDVTFREWLKQNQQDIVPTIDRVFATLLQVVGAKEGAQGKPSVLRPRRGVERPRADVRGTRYDAPAKRRKVPLIRSK